MTPGEIRTLFDYDRWATVKLLGVIGTISDDLYRKDLGSSHGGIHGTLVHLIGACDVWLRRWQGESPTKPWRDADFQSFADLRTAWDTIQAALAAYLETLSDEQLSSPLHYKDMKGNAYATVLWKQMQHLVNHGSYHRGQIVTLLRIMGVTPVGTDLIHYYREKEKHA
ncbi:MAG: DinB family protein [Bacteroidota bacterium]